MKSEFKSMQQALERLVQSFIEDSTETYSGWDVSYSTNKPGDSTYAPDDIPVAASVISGYEISIRFRCQRSCCKEGPDECAHRVSIYFSLDEKDNRASLWLVLGGLPDHDEDSFPKIEGSNEYDVDSFPMILLDAPTMDTVLDAGKRLLAQVPEWHRFLAADTIDWRTRLDMSMS